MKWPSAHAPSSDDNFSLIAALTEAFQSEPIALVALGLAGIVGLVGLIHNRQSVRPLLRFRVNTIITSSSSSTLDDHSFELSLHNVGLGPAIITEWSIYKDGERVQLPRLESEWIKLLESIGIVGVSPSFGNIVADETLAPRKDDAHLVLRIGNTGLPVERDFRPELNRLNFKCKYRSMYRFSGQMTEFHEPEAYKRIVQEWKDYDAAARAGESNPKNTN